MQDGLVPHFGRYYTIRSISIFLLDILQLPRLKIIRAVCFLQYQIFTVFLIRLNEGVERAATKPTFGGIPREKKKTLCLFQYLD